jgi:signal transduction histidine kinase
LAAALFDRCQIAVSVLAGSSVFHLLVPGPATLDYLAHAYVVLPCVLAAALVDYMINVAFVSSYMKVATGLSFREIIGQLRFGSGWSFIANYVGLALVGAVLAQLYQRVDIWAVILFIVPLLLARQMFFRTMALEEAHKELKDRERVLRALSNRMAEERQDERLQIAGYLHDDLAQMLFRLTLQVEMAKKRLGLRELEAVDRDLDGIITTKQQASDMVRALIRDLHRSPIGRAGLAEALHSFALDAGKSFTTQITTDVEEVTLPPPITLLIYQIAREATMNALKHAEAENIWVSLRNTDDGVALEVRDDGKGFDTAAPPPEGHFGSVMMKERAQVAGGTFSVTSELGHGSIIRASFPRVWVEEGTLHEAEGTSRVPESARAPVGSTSAATGMAIGGSKAQGQGSSDDEGAQPASEPTPRPHGSKEEEKEKDPRAARAVSA